MKRNRRTFAARRRGFTTVSALLLLSVAVGMVLVVSNASVQQVRLAGMSRDKQTALTIAEAGVEEAVDSFRADRNFRGKTEKLYTDAPAKTRYFGEFATTIVPIDKHQYKVLSTGTNPNGSKRGVVAIVEIPTYKLGEAAIKASEEVLVKGSAQIGTQPGDLHIADIQSNGTISMGGSSGVDGTLYAVGTIDAPDYQTGQVYAPSVTDAPPIIFPDAEEVAEMKAKLLAESRATGQTLPSVRRTLVIETPAYISGDLVLNNDETVVLSGNGTVFVTGDVRLNGQAVLVNEGTLAVGGTFHQSGGATYKVTPGVIPTPTVAVFNERREDPAITLAGGAETIQQGVISAVRGGIKRSGGTVFAGALVAGGADGTVTVEGNYQHLYPEKMYSRIEFPGEPRLAFWGETDG